MMNVVNMLAGPGAGKSRTATGVFSALKELGFNAEYVPEFAKDAAWENRGKKFFAAQQYIYGEQSWRLERLVGDVDIAVTDAPLPQGIAYFGKDHSIPSLRKTILEDFNRYNNLNIFLQRPATYNPKGRNQSFQEACELDLILMNILKEEGIPFHSVRTGPGCVNSVLNVIRSATDWMED